MEGECDFHLAADGSKFFEVRCDAYNRRRGVLHNFYLENIREFKKQGFGPAAQNDVMKSAIDKAAAINPNTTGEVAALPNNDAIVPHKVATDVITVSYTHLTLPTNREV